MPLKSKLAVPSGKALQLIEALATRANLNVGRLAVQIEVDQNDDFPNQDEIDAHFVKEFKLKLKGGTYDPNSY